MKTSKKLRRGLSSLSGSSKKAYAKAWEGLSPKEKELRIRALEVLRLMRKGDSLTSSSKQVGIDPRASKLQLGRYIHKKRRRWKAGATDKLERGLKIYKKGRIQAIVINNSATASVIGEYFNDTKKLLESGDLTLLKKYKKVTIIDAYGKKHKLETRIEQIKEIERGREEVEFADIYAY